MEIKEAIRKIVGEFNPALGVICTVVSVGSTTCVCSPIDGSADIEDVRLKAGDGDGLLMIPAVDSVVIVQMVNDVEGYISMFSQLDSIKMLDGSFDGLVKVGDLVTKLNNIENKVNDIITTYNAHTHAVSGSATLIPNGSPIAPPLANTTQADIENDKITHGS